MRRAVALALAGLVVGAPAAEGARTKRCKGGKAKACRVLGRPAPVARGSFGALVRRRTTPRRPVAAAPAPAPARPAPEGARTTSPAPVAAPPPPTTPVAAPATAAPSPVVAPARLQVTAREWSLTLSRPSIVAGAAIVELVNRGEDGHDLRMERDGAVAATWDELAPGATERQGLDLPTGRYVLFCSLPGHRQAGMQAVLAVG